MTDTASMNMENVKSIFSRKLKSALRQKNIDNNVLAAEIEVTPQAISNYMNGKNFPTSENLVKICKYLGISLDALFENDIARARGPETYKLISALRQLGFACTDIGCDIDTIYDDKMSKQLKFTIEFSKEYLQQQLTRTRDDMFIDEVTLNDDIWLPQWKAISFFMSRWKKHYEMLINEHIDRDEYNVLMENTLQKAEEIIERGNV